VDEASLPYLVMEYIPGKTLQQRLDEQGPLDLSDVLRLGKQIADGLAAAHAEKLIHRDVKPGNILLETSIDDHVKITDFGLARAADDASMMQSGMIAGTPLYMAPEQALGQKLDQRADLFSLGSVLYQMLTGRPPFRASNTLAVLKRVTEDTPRPIQDLIPEIPEWMCEIVTRLHTKNPDERYASAKEVSEVLEHCLAELQEKRVPDVGAITSAALRPVASSATPSSRRPLRMVALVTVMLLIGLGITESTGLTHLISGATSSTPVSKKITAVPEKISNTEIVTNDVPASPLLGADDAPPLASAPFDADMAKQHQQAWAKHLGLPVEKEIVLSQNPDGTDVNLTMVLIPPGDYLMGTNDVDKFELFKETKAANPEANLTTLAMESPQHYVRITKPFWLSKYEFTTGQFRNFVEGTQYQTDAETNGIGGTKPEPGRNVAHSPDINWDTLNKARGDVKYDNGPVVNVSWNDAAACCQWLSSQHADVTFSLPTEAQWEYACRAGTMTPWYRCESSESLAQYAQFETNVKWTKPGGGDCVPTPLAFTICTAMSGNGAMTRHL
jgi:serine/threonine protein kinase